MPPPPDDLLRLGAATLGESGGRPMHSRIRPTWPGAALAGPVFTARCEAGDNLAIHVATAQAPVGSVLVVDASGDLERGNWGEVLTTQAVTRRLKGLVIDGGVRDVAALEAHGFPVFSERIALPGAAKEQPGEVDGAVTVGDQVVRPGDWVVADVDGVVVLDGDRLDEIAAAGQARAAREADIFERLRKGETTLDVFGL